MLNYLGVFCQLKKLGKLKFLLFSLLLFSCSTTKENFELGDAKPMWLDSPRQFRLSYSTGSKPPVHLFFDHYPYVNLKKQLLNVAVVTPANSEVEYGFDMVSGQFYTKRFYCKRNDVWKNYEKSLDKPPYTIAFVPRLLDTIGNPQRVLVFGGEKFFYKNFSQKQGENWNKTVRVRVVGSVVLQFCDLFPCSNNKWESQMVLLAVDPRDSRYKKITTLEQLKSVVDWNMVKAYMQNGQGRSFDGMKDSHGNPAYRVIRGSEAEKSLKFAFRNGHYFKFKELTKLRSSCFTLYDYIWGQVKRVRTNYAKLKKIQEKKSKYRKYGEGFEKKKDQFSGNVLQDTSILEGFNVDMNEINRKHLTFVKFMKKFEKKFGEEFYLCTRYVRSASINNNPERQIFMDFLTAFYNLDRLGHNFQCYSGTWAPRRNFYLSKRRHKNLFDRLQNCNTEKLNRVFSSMTNYINSLAKGDHRSIRYIDYDNGPYGTHAKLYSWIWDKGKHFKCEKEQKKVMREETFPAEFKWKPFVDLNDRRFRTEGYIE